MNGEMIGYTIGALGLAGGAIAFFWRKFDQMQADAQQRNAALIDERHRQKCAELEDHGSRIRELEQNRYQDMLQLTDRFIEELRKMEHAAHTDRLAVMERLGQVQGKVDLVNQSTDRATADIGALRATLDNRLHENDQKVASLEADFAALAEQNRKPD